VLKPADLRLTVKSFMIRRDKMRSQVIDGITIYKPTAEDINALQIGDLVPDCFGRLKPVERIYARGTDRYGKVYVLFYTKQSETSSMSGDLHEDQIVLTLENTAKWNSSDAIPWVG
jgi:hypothetical protein